MTQPRHRFLRLKVTSPPSPYRKSMTLYGNTLWQCYCMFFIQTECSQLPGPRRIKRGHRDRERWYFSPQFVFGKGKRKRFDAPVWTVTAGKFCNNEALRQLALLEKRGLLRDSKAHRLAHLEHWLENR